MKASGNEQTGRLDSPASDQSELDAHLANIESLRSILRPRSVAVVGATDRKDALGAAILRNLFRLRFQGPIYPVNPRAKFIHSTRAYASLADIPDPVDLAIIVVPRKAVRAVVEECAAKGVRGIVVITAGFKETGPEGAADETEILEIVRSHGMRMVGPNCMGVISTAPETMLDATFAPVAPSIGTVGLGTQSGALGVVMIDYARDLNLGVSDFVSMGNKSDVSGNDLLEWWEDDPRTNVILLYLESFGNPQKFARMARRINRKKPIVAVKSGRTEKGLQAVSSHTGSLAGTDRAVEALVAQTGIIRVDTVDELFDMAAFLAHQPVPTGRRVGIITNAGGPAILATDACAAWDLDLPEPGPETKARLAEFLPKEASIKNPIDMIASAGADEYEQATRVLLESDEFDALIVLVVRPVTMDASEIGHAVVRGSEGAKKPVISCFMGRQGIPEALSSLKAGNIPSYSFPESAVRALSRAAQYGDWLRRPIGDLPVVESIDRPAVRALLDRAKERLGSRGGWLDPSEVDELLGACRIETPRTGFASDPKSASRLAASLGFPVVMKVEADGVEHKTDVGGVRLDVRNEDEVERTFEQIRASLGAAGIAPGAMRGVTIQPMIQDGVETIIGVSEDEAYGHLLMFGLGGIHVELLLDVAFRLVPVTDLDASELVRSVRGFPLLEGYRGAEHADVPALESILKTISTLALEFPEIRELDLNPVKVRKLGRGCVTVDARVRV